MKVEFFCPYWGSEQIPFDQFLDRVVEAGFDGVEMSLPLVSHEREKIVLAIRMHSLKLIAQHWETIDKDFETHYANFGDRLHNLALGRPEFINSQTGKDYFSQEQNMALIELAASIANATGIPVVHETHRGKWSFAAHITAAFLISNPEIRLTLDVSHWCNVAESFLEDQSAVMEKVIGHTDHIHSRVGHPQAPQVSDPRAPEWQIALNLHLAWWDRIIDRHRKRGSKIFTITTEFGPPPYLPQLPFSMQTVADQWEINVFMMNLLKERYNCNTGE